MRRQKQLHPKSTRKPNPRLTSLDAKLSAVQQSKLVLSPSASEFPEILGQFPCVPSTSASVLELGCSPAPTKRTGDGTRRNDRNVETHIDVGVKSNDLDFPKRLLSQKDTETKERLLFEWETFEASYDFASVVLEVEVLLKRARRDIPDNLPFAMELKMAVACDALQRLCSYSHQFTGVLTEIRDTFFSALFVRPSERAPAVPVKTTVTRSMAGWSEGALGGKSQHPHFSQLASSHTPASAVRQYASRDMYPSIAQQLLRENSYKDTAPHLAKAAAALESDAKVELLVVMVDQCREDERLDLLARLVSRHAQMRLGVLRSLSAEEREEVIRDVEMGVAQDRRLPILLSLQAGLGEMERRSMLKALALDHCSGPEERAALVSMVVNEGGGGGGEEERGKLLTRVIQMLPSREEQERFVMLLLQQLPHHNRLNMLLAVIKWLETQDIATIEERLLNELSDTVIRELMAGVIKDMLTTSRFSLLSRVASAMEYQEQAALVTHMFSELRPGERVRLGVLLLQEGYNSSARKQLLTAQCQQMQEERLLLASAALDKASSPERVDVLVSTCVQCLESFEQELMAEKLMLGGSGDGAALARQTVLELVKTVVQHCTLAEREVVLGREGAAAATAAAAAGVSTGLGGGGGSTGALLPLMLPILRSRIRIVQARLRQPEELGMQDIEQLVLSPQECLEPTTVIRHWLGFMLGVTAAAGSSLPMPMANMAAVVGRMQDGRAYCRLLSRIGTSSTGFNGFNGLNGVLGLGQLDAGSTSSNTSNHLSGGKRKDTNGPAIESGEQNSVATVPDLASTASVSVSALTSPRTGSEEEVMEDVTVSEQSDFGSCEDKHKALHGGGDGRLDVKQAEREAAVRARRHQLQQLRSAATRCEPSELADLLAAAAASSMDVPTSLWAGLRLGAGGAEGETGGSTCGGNSHGHFRVLGYLFAVWPGLDPRKGLWDEDDDLLESLGVELDQLEGKKKEDVSADQLSSIATRILEVEMRAEEEQRRVGAAHEMYLRARQAVLSQVMHSLTLGSGEDDGSLGRAEEDADTRRFCRLRRRKMHDIWPVVGTVGIGAAGGSPSVEADFAATEQVLHEKGRSLAFIYKAYSTIGGEAGSINAEEFLKLVKDIKILTPAFSEYHVLAIFKHANRASTEGTGTEGQYSSENPSDELVPEEYVEALVRIAAQRLGKPVGPSFRSLVEDWVLPHARRSEVDLFRERCAAAEVQTVLIKYGKSLRTLYKQYASVAIQGQGSVNTSSNGTAALGSVGGTGMGGGGEMSVKDFYRLLQDHRLTDGALGSKAVQNVFNYIQQDQDGNSLSFIEFLEGICACAMFKYPNPFLAFDQRLDSFFSQLLTNSGDKKAPQRKRRLVPKKI